MNQLTFDDKGDYLICKAKGKDTWEFSKHMWTELKQHLDDKGLKKAVVISNLDNPANFVDYIKLFPFLISLGFNNSYKGAYVEKNSKATKFAKFTEDYLVNRGLSNCKIFSNENKAFSWIKEN